MNFLTARNMAERIRRKKLDELLIQTAFAGMPVPSRALAVVYLRAGIDYVNKSIKYILSFERTLKKDYYTYSLIVVGRIESIRNTLEEISLMKRFNISDIDNVVSKLEEAMGMIKEIENEISSYMPH